MPGIYIIPSSSLLGMLLINTEVCGGVGLLIGAFGVGANEALALGPSSTRIFTTLKPFTIFGLDTFVSVYLVLYFKITSSSISGAISFKF